MQKRIKQSSFTLIELLVVIVIIGILAGVIVVSTSSAITSSQNTKLVAELSNLSKSLEGYSSYPVGSLCIEDTSNNSDFLSYLGLTTFPIHPNYKTGDTALTTNDCFLYFSDGENYSIRTPAMGNKGYLIQESRNPQTKDIQKSCEPGWIPFGNRCVMKYEAKAMKTSDNSINLNGCNDAACSISTYTAVSVEEGKPWVKISQTNAKAACEAIGAHLITNAEWMAIARDIESVNSNWSDTVLNRGHTDNSPANSLPASTDNNPYSGTEQTSGGQKRTHTLSNGEIIWDIAGNVYEWVDDKIECGIVSCPNTLMPYDSSPASEWVEYTNISTWGKYSKAELAPRGAYTSSNGVGKIYTDYDEAAGSSDIYTHAFLRGGHWNSGANAGVFALNLNYSPSCSGTNIGFRCAR